MILVPPTKPSSLQPETEAEHFKETEAASAKGAQAVAPEATEELVQQSLGLPTETSQGRTQRLS